MLSATKLRVSLAIVTLAGAFHLNGVQAAESGRAAPCDTWADGYAVGFCAAKGGRPSSVTYTCNTDGTATIHEVTCLEEAH
jgi:hypothetical protein